MTSSSEAPARAPNAGRSRNRDRNSDIHKAGERGTLADSIGNVPTDEAKLPQRVLEAIRAQEDTSEVLIRLIQLGVVTIFGMLYTVSPKTDAGTAFTSVPYILASYFVLTFTGLLFALRTRLPDWAVYLSILFDVSLLMALIFSFHIQYEQPATFSLKVPTLLYIFIFIGLRCLRFEPRFVIATGVMAALGWLGMILYVLWSDTTGDVITRNYIAYMRGDALLIGAELDKIIAILMVTFILALSLRRARRLLIGAVRESMAAREMARFFDEGVAMQIREAERDIEVGEGVKREAAILYIDIRGFSARAAEIAPDRVLSLLAEYQARFVPIVQKHGGNIDKFLGDGIMATFGAVSASETYAADALRCVDEVVKAAKAWSRGRQAEGKQPFQINAGVASGSIVFGAVGEQSRLEYTVIGTAVNLGAKLEKHNKTIPAVALTTAETYRRALQQGYPVKPEAKQFRATVEGLSGERDLVILHR